MKIERMMYILITLLSQKYFKASDIAEMYHVSSRTIYRDIETLSLAGIPIYSRQGNEGGFYLDEDYKLSSLLFSDMEKRTLLELSQSISTSYHHPKMEELSQKMSYMIKDNETRSPYFFDLSLWKSQDYALEKIERAIENNQIISFDYVRYDGEASQRVVEPINLVYKSYHWYLYAFCRLREDTRLFRLSRIRHTKFLEETYKQENRDTLNKETLEQFFTKLEQKIEMIPVELHFSNQVKAKVYDSFLEKDIKEMSEYIIVKKSMPDEEWLVEMLLGYGEDVKVISPKSLQEKIINKARNILKQYDIQVS
ncbi:helix-turn-helix transcriptional regulator [Vagococcus sp.]|uniref:helix-turn-helix transcriptional regulator n=1 Tax=Vagococcus sp. TaxID=1933889 RepID=UPI002FC78661